MGIFYFLCRRYLNIEYSLPYFSRHKIATWP
nr:MAG TPA: hypothetical protein [Caudoviricetes sp.]